MSNEKPTDEQIAMDERLVPYVADLVKADIDARVEKGIETYGKPLFPHNGRDALRDAYEEAIDLAKYLRQALYERDGK
jgi:hypothetical protein